MAQLQVEIVNRSELHRFLVLPKRWLLTEADLPAICIEARQAKAAMEAMPNKTDRNDARGPPRSCAPAGIGRCT